MHDRTGSLAKTHRGLRSEFARLTLAEPRIDQAYSRFLANAYELKSIADYGTDSGSVTSEAADAAIDTAERMIDAVATVLGETGYPAT